jgi:spoIIIJ-associated protein
MDTAQVQGQQWLEEMLRLAGLPASVQVDQSRTEAEGSCWLNIDQASLTPEQTQALIGADGSGLDAIQYLANTILNIGQAEAAQTAYTVELAGYRVRRQAELQALAEAAAQQVRQTGSEYEMAALSSAERRQVHTYLKATYSDLVTHSRGKEPDRRLVVSLATEGQVEGQVEPQVEPQAGGVEGT